MGKTPGVVVFKKMKRDYKNGSVQQENRTELFFCPKKYEGEWSDIYRDIEGSTI